MKRIRKTCLFGFCLVGLIGLCFLAEHLKVSSRTKDAQIFTPPIAAKTQPSPAGMEALECIYRSFDHNADGTWIYPDDFGGAYLDEDGTIVVVLTDPSETCLEKYKTLVGSSDTLTFTRKEFSYNELMRVGQEVAACLMKNGCRSVAFGPYDSENKVLITIREDFFEKAKTLAADLGVTDLVIWNLSPGDIQLE